MRRFSAVVTGDAHRPDCLLERSGFELPSPLISGWFRELAGIWILRRKIVLVKKIP
jgi:hypothetical protein